MKEIATVEEFAAAIEKGQHVFYFTADWCGDCRYIEPSMPEIVAAFPSYQFVKVDRDHFMPICEKLQIMGIPSFVVVKDGREQGRLVNKHRKTQAEICQFLEKIIVEAKE